MITQDIFVGVVALLTGIFVFASAAFQSQWIGRFWVTRRIENAANGSVSRLVIMGIGALCSILGTLLILGFFPSGNSNIGNNDVGRPGTGTESDWNSQLVPSRR